MGVVHPTVMIQTLGMRYDKDLQMNEFIPSVPFTQESWIIANTMVQGRTWFMSIDVKR